MYNIKSTDGVLEHVANNNIWTQDGGRSRGLRQNEGGISRIYYSPNIIKLSVTALYLFPKDLVLVLSCSAHTSPYTPVSKVTG